MGRPASTLSHRSTHFTFCIKSRMSPVPVGSGVRVCLRTGVGGVGCFHCAGDRVFLALVAHRVSAIMGANSG